jgi:hypothetical protein
MAQDDRIQYEVSVNPPEEGRPARLYVWVRRFQGDEELTGRYEVFENLARLDEFIARAAGAGEDTPELRTARERFAEILTTTPE